ncbi:hypothetical protein HEK616_59840 [Streptomyces nigrescens]|uniref:Uncharacterized protein n=1 Tax=Streptomyces nigrescens TaxID=1920 RepID=A0ABM8A1H3_STRNI|nr:hypothetical protein HEK616_59840 [Streptomyces nigrescens]
MGWVLAADFVGGGGWGWGMGVCAVPVAHGRGMRPACGVRGATWDAVGEPCHAHGPATHQSRLPRTRRLRGCPCGLTTAPTVSVKVEQARLVTVLGPMPPKRSVNEWMDTATDLLAYRITLRRR